MLSKIKINIKTGQLYYYESHDGGVFFLLDRESGVCLAKTCREEFASVFTRTTNLIGFDMPSAINATRFDKFLTHIEEKLKLKQKSIIYKTNRARSILIRPSPFWLSSKASRSWLTLFVRCGIVYYKDSFNGAYINYELTSYILPVISRFLSGYTKLNGRLGRYGIVETFAHWNNYQDRFLLKDNWEELLRKP